MAELVNDRLGDALPDVFLVFAGLLDRQLIDGDAVRQRIAVVGIALGEGVP